MPSKKYKIPLPKPLSYVIIFLLAFGAGYKLHEEKSKRVATPIPIKSSENIRVYFSPRGGCTDAIVNAIDEAKHTIYVFAFALTSKPIAEALVRAHRRGVEVRIVADKGQSKGRGSKLSYLREQGIPIWIDKVSGYAHNKVMVIDEGKVLTGSFNYSANAEYRNAENQLIIISQPLALLYIDNWHMRMKKGYAYTG